MYQYLAKDIRVIDGDTIHATIDLGFHCATNQTFRLARINAYEMTEPRGIVARAYVCNIIGACAAVRITSTKQEKYGRWLAEVDLLRKATDVEWLNLNDDLVRHGHAVYQSYN
jgi:endonuclease YncB( thermonuclease family)